MYFYLSQSAKSHRVSVSCLTCPKPTPSKNGLRDALLGTVQGRVGERGGPGGWGLNPYSGRGLFRKMNFEKEHQFNFQGVFLLWLLSQPLHFL